MTTTEKIISTESEKITWSEVIDHIAVAFRAGYDQGYAEGRRDRLEDERLAGVHDLACRTIGLSPHDGPPMWSVSS
jgi:hypothetical protein